MERLEAIKWLEEWADRHDVAVAPLPGIRSGESRAGLPVQLLGRVSLEGMRELMGMGKQLTFVEMGRVPKEPAGVGKQLRFGETAPPAAGDPARGSAAGVHEDDPPFSITEGRVTNEPFRGFQAGEDQLFVGLDQVTLTGHGEEQRLACLSMLQKYLGDGQPGLYGKNFYRETWIFDCGAMLCFSPRLDHWSLFLRGRSMRQVGQERHQRFIVDLWKHSSYATRCDVRVDDYSRELIRVEDFVDAYNVGNWSGARKAKMISEKELVKGGCKTVGAGVAFGTRSGARLLIYDKALESKGEICSNRAELAYYDDRAKEAWERLAKAAMESESSLTRVMGSLVTGPVDFVRRSVSAHRHVGRMERCAWWQRLHDALGNLRLKVVKPVSSLMTCAAAIARQYVKKIARMAVISERAGVDLYHAFFQEIERAREGQELCQVPIAPREVGFDVLQAFKPEWVRRAAAG